MTTSKKPTLSPAQQIALWADQLRDMSAMGLRFVTDQYDEERYHTIQEIAMAMLALATDTPLNEIEPLRAPIFSRPTPFAVGGGAVIDDEGRILLIQRADNQLWAMPGGAFEVGETPAQGAVREIYEETGVRCKPISLIGVFDSRYCGTLSRHHLYQFLFLCQPLPQESVSAPSHDNEVLNTGWFTEAELPSNLDPGHVSRIPEAFRVWHGDQRPFFDKIY